MNAKFRLILSDKIIRVSVMTSIVLIIIETLIVLFTYNLLPPLVPFFNSKPWGEERLASSGIIFALPPLLFTIFMVNNLLSAYYYSKNTLVSRILSFTSLLVTILTGIAIVQIVFLVY